MKAQAQAQIQVASTAAGARILGQMSVWLSRLRFKSSWLGAPRCYGVMP
jgi:hypothetical protein